MVVSCEAEGYYGPKYLAKLLSEIDESAIPVPTEQYLDRWRLILSRG
jgi:hypothetical protein